MQAFWPARRRDAASPPCRDTEVERHDRVQKLNLAVKVVVNPIVAAREELWHKPGLPNPVLWETGLVAEVTLVLACFLWPVQGLWAMTSAEVLPGIRRAASSM